jgi:hypothetical protein
MFQQRQEQMAATLYYQRLLQLAAVAVALHQALVLMAVLAAVAVTLVRKQADQQAHLDKEMLAAQVKVQLETLQQAVVAALQQQATQDRVQLPQLVKVETVQPQLIQVHQ